MDITALFALLACLCIVYVEARGGRGGGGRGGSGRGGRSRGTGRSRSSGASRYRSAYSSYRLGSTSSIRSALLLGTVYGATRWRLRRPNYHYDDDDLPQICYNDKYKENEYGNVSYYGRFICPGEHQDDDYNDCCGEEGMQYCCKYKWWIGLLVFGIILCMTGFVISFICLQRYCKKRRIKAREKTTPRVTMGTSKPENSLECATPTTCYSSHRFNYPATATTGIQAPTYTVERPPPYTANGYSSVCHANQPTDIFATTNHNQTMATMFPTRPNKTRVTCNHH